MSTRALAPILTTLYSELLDGAPAALPAVILNRGDEGLLASLDRLSAADASRSSAGGAPIAAHVDHLRYGFSLMNRWTPGGNPWKDGDWRTSWRIATVDEDEWKRLRAALREETHRFIEKLRTPMEVSETEVKVIVGNLAHLAYHIGAIRQIHRGAGGPTAEDEARLAAPGAS